MISSKKILFIAFTLSLIVAACGSSSSDDDGPTNNPDTFDRGALLTNLADNIIIPAFQELNLKLEVLKSSKDDFIAAPNQNNLDGVRVSWLSAYKTWQSVEMFNIGKAEEISYVFQMNVYPVSETDVEANIASGSYDLTHVNNNDAVGFPAIDYLLWGVASDDVAIINTLSDTKYAQYLSDVVDQMQALTETVLSDWTSSYRDAFVSQTGNTATSALNKFTNDYVFYFEKGLRANKIGIPAGNFSSTALPEKVEGFYSKFYSKELAILALDAAQAVFNGEAFSSNATGESFNTYLTSLDRNDLASLINSRMNDARQKLEVLSADLNQQIITDNTKMTEAYDALQLVVVSLKVDMLQAFNISVDYVDADGD